ncbi:MAG: phosphatidate cytidylyltransferase [Dehalococcoidales bacterium]|nr:phosphatidate cytidylyltransferase [Dehalococcoidales bacterium]
MLKRIITALILVPILAVCIWFNNAPLPLFAVLLTVACELALKEFYDIAVSIGHKPFRRIGHVAIVFLIFALYISRLAISSSVMYISPVAVSFVLVGVIAAVVLCNMLRHRDYREGADSAAWTMFGIIYLGLLPSFYVNIGGAEDGKFLLIFAFVNVFAIDIFSYFVGVSLGRHHFAPNLSPKKSVEGLFGGFAGLIASALLLNHFLHIGFAVWQVILYCVTLFPVAVFGDLIESYFKRSANLKDSSNLLPGHGGMLDRIDSLIMSGLVTFLWSMVLAL